MGERFNTRALVVSRALAGSFSRRARPPAAKRILVAHNLLLGDTLMLTPLLAKLRANHRDAARHVRFKRGERSFRLFAGLVDLSNGQERPAATQRAR